MNDILQFLNTNSGALSVLFSGIVTLSTVVYAFLTWKLVSETRSMRKAQTDAKVSISFETIDDFISGLNLVVRNEGVGPAREISFDVDLVPGSEGDESLINSIKNLGIIEKGIEYLSPDRQFKTFLTSMLENFEKKIQTKINVKVSYLSPSGERHQDDYLLDFSSLRGLRQLGTPPLHSMAKNLEKIQKDLNHLSTGFKKLKVIAYTKQDIVDEQKEWEEYVQKIEDKAESTQQEAAPDGTGSGEKP